MLSEYSREQMLATVRGSPDAVAAHDKEAWLGLFADTALVNDPVGSRPHGDAGAISRFYDAFIAPNDIRFDVAHDIVCHDTVARDVVIRIEMASGLEVSVPAYLRYELMEQQGGLRINGLFAHWELMPMVVDTLGSGVRGWTTYASLTKHMIACQGVGGVLGFSRGFLGAGRAGKRNAQAFLEALARRDTGTAGARMAPGATFEVPKCRVVTILDAAERMANAHFSKLIVSGNTVTATISLGDQLGIVLLELDNNRRIARARLYIE